jgi:hypothetical protein
VVDSKRFTSKTSEHPGNRLPAEKKAPAQIIASLQVATQEANLNFHAICCGVQDYLQ